jgi:hypothetical protein
VNGTRFRAAAIAAAVVAASPAAAQTATLSVYAKASAAGTFTGRVELAPALDVDPPGAGPEDLPASAPTTPSIACRTGDPASCVATATLGSIVVLQAVNVSNAAFVGWSGCTSLTAVPGGLAPRCNVSMASARTVSATFKAATFELRARTYSQYGAAGRIEAPTSPALRCQTGATDPALQACSGAAANGASVAAMAVPEANARVVAWSGCTPSADLSTCTAAMTVDRTISATFGPSAWAVAVLFDGGNGTVTGEGVSCSATAGGDCTGLVAIGGTLALTATADATSRFVGWTGCTSVSGSVCTLSALTAPATVVASFESALCQACHGVPPPAPHEARLDCGTCHRGYASDSVDAAIHMDGKVDFMHGGSCGGQPSSSTCTDCHPCGGVRP